MDDTVVAKAKRRIKRVIKTGEHQARVYPTDDPKMFEYKVRHHLESLFFKRDVLGRLRLME